MFNKIIIALLLSLSFASVSFANDKSPVMVIRFNSDSVSYDRQISKIVKSATKIKQDVNFDLVYVTPKNGEKNNSRFARVAAKIANEGVDKQNIHSSYQSSELTKYDEVHIFVR